MDRQHALSRELPSGTVTLDHEVIGLVTDFFERSTTCFPLTKPTWHPVPGDLAKGDVRLKAATLG
jgi:hypothetical protein